MPSDLPPKMEALYKALDGQGDVHVLHLWEAIIGRPANDHITAQQNLRRYIVRLNKHLEDTGESVEIGSLRATYRLLKNA